MGAQPRSRNTIWWLLALVLVGVFVIWCTACSSPNHQVSRQSANPARLGECSGTNDRATFGFAGRTEDGEESEESEERAARL